jgi:wyosine [tRNA(Phe)-imidazoG37] synthetase (radical SAM superfamily)
LQTLSLQRGVIYGPVDSRRLGRSLGINLLPTGYKLCAFDCIYCQYGRTKVLTAKAEEEPFPTVEVVLRKVEEALRQVPDLNYATFSGNGEPTLHPHFHELVEGVIHLRDKLRPEVKTAILSNSALVGKEEIREDLAKLDLLIMKLDAGDPLTWRAINRPAPSLDFETVVAGLKELKEVTIQSLILDGPVQNMRGKAFDRWVETLTSIAPQEVQIYTTDRPVAEAKVERMPKVVLQEMAKEAEARTGIPVRAY